MLAYLSYLYIPRQNEIPRVEIISTEDDCLAFRSEEEIPQGVRRVATKTARGTTTFEVDVYRYDPESGLHEGRLVRGTARRVSPESNCSRVPAKAQYGHLQERFRSGVTIRFDEDPGAGAIVKLELEDLDGVTEVRHARVAWSRKLPGGQHEVRLNFQDPRNLEQLPRDRFQAVS